MDIKGRDHERFIKRMYYLLLAMYAGSILPLVWIGFYNWPSADDYSMAFEVHEAFTQTGSVFVALSEGIRMAYHYYMNWTGYYFSDFVTAMAPSVFGESCYVVVTLLVLSVFTFSMLYFFHALFTKMYGVQWHLAGAIAFLVMLLIVQCMPAEGGTRTEAFYWWAGACNYMLMWSLGVLWCGLLISCKCDTGKKRRWEYLCACVLGFLLGGANYMTGLTLAIISVVVIFTRVTDGTVPRSPQNGDRGDSPPVTLGVPVPLSYFPALPCLLNLAGFAAACLAPGNRVRGAFGEGFPAVKSVLVSLYYTLSYCMSEWTTWVVICILLLLALLLWMAAGEAVTHFRHPVIACVLAYGLISANMTPILFTRGDIGAGRMQSIEWAQYILLLVLAIAYCMGYAAQVIRRRHVLRLDADEEAAIRREKLLRHAAVLLALFIVFGSALCVAVNPHYYTSTSAVTDLMNGSAELYRTESRERLQILNDASVQDAVLPEYSVKPELLYFSDVFRDETEWVNTATATYYHKNTVRVRE